MSFGAGDRTNDPILDEWPYLNALSETLSSEWELLQPGMVASCSESVLWFRHIFLLLRELLH